MLMIVPILIISLQECSAITVQNGCIVSGDSMICNHQIPNKIYSNVSKVVIKDYLNSTINQLVFKETSWESVKSIDITVNTMTHFILEKNNFFLLKGRLSILRIHAPKLDFIHENSFDGLTSLRTLDLSRSVYINGTQLSTALLKSKLKIVELNLCFILSTRPFQMDQKFMQVLSDMNVERLILSGSSLALKGPLDIKNLPFKIIHFDISNTTLMVSDLNLDRVVKVMTLLLVHVQFIDMSYPMSPVLEIDYNFLKHVKFIYSCKGHKFLEIFYKTQHLFLNGLAQYDISAYDSIVDMSLCNVSLNSLHFKDNKVVYLNVTVRWPIKNNLEVIDLSNNDMEYLSPRFFTGLTKLKYLDLSVNKLYAMEKFEVFASLLLTFPELRILNMSNNNLTYLPKQLFESNAKMITIDLSNNELTSIAFHVRQFKHLKELNLRNNRIIYLEETNVNKLNYLLHLPVKTDIDLTDNPFECTCQTVRFQKWVVSNLQAHSNHTYKCNQHGKTLFIDYGTVEKSQYLCKRTAIIVGWICGSVALVTVIVSVASAFYVRKRNVKHRQIRSCFVNEFVSGALSNRYLCFLSFSSQEDSKLITEVSGSIDQNLQLLTGISNRNLVCIGDQNFRVGYPVVNEIYRLVDESCVIVCIVSRLFCASRWCELELRVAREKNKPIVLIFREKLKRTEMPELIQNILDTRTRGKLIFENGAYIMIPGYDVLSASIFDLALKDFANLRNIQYSADS